MITGHSKVLMDLFKPSRLIRMMFNRPPRRENPRLIGSTSPPGGRTLPGLSPYGSAGNLKTTAFGGGSFTFRYTLFILLFFLPAAQAQTNRVIVYGSQDCSNCLRVRQALDDRHVRYIFQNVDEDSLAQGEMIVHLNEAGLGGEQIKLPVIAGNGLYINDARSVWRDHVKSMASSSCLEFFAYGQHRGDREFFHALRNLGMEIVFRDLQNGGELDRLNEYHREAGRALVIEYPVIVAGNAVFNNGAQNLDVVGRMIGVTLTLPVLALSQPVEMLNEGDESERLLKESVALGMLDSCLPEAALLIRDVMNAPDKIIYDRMVVDLGEPQRLSAWLSESGEETIALELNIAVHEMLHEYVRRMAWQQPAQQADSGNAAERRVRFAYPAPTGEVFLVEKTAVFPTLLMHESFPRQCRGERYEVYINTRTLEMNSQQHGVYGLLDELCAYYWGTLAALQLETFFQTQTEKSPQKWLEWVSAVSSTLSAYGEFRLYILHYMDFARTFHTQVYQDIVKNLAFVKALIWFDINFLNLQKDFSVRLDQLKTRLDRNNVHVAQARDAFFIGIEGRKLFLEDQNRHLQYSQGERYGWVRADLGLN